MQHPALCQPLANCSLPAAATCMHHQLTILPTGPATPSCLLQVSDFVRFKPSLFAAKYPHQQHCHCKTLLLNCPKG
jgi:hypothetical protein